MSILLRFLLLCSFLSLVAPAARTQSADEVPLVQPDASAPDNGENIRQAAAKPMDATPPSSAELGGSNGETNYSPRFCAQLWLVAERTFFATAAHGQLPAFRPVRNATRGHQFFAAILFANCVPDPRGAASVNYDVTVRRPDGTLYGQSKSLVGCQGPLAARPAAANSSPSLSAAESPPPVATPAAAPALQLGRDYLGILLGDNDPVGVYTVEALVRDRIGDTELALKTTFTVL